MAKKSPDKTVSSSDADAIIAQICAAFGQGASSFRIHRDALTTLIARYRPILPLAAATWETDGAQALERIKAVGRSAASFASANGETTIGKTHVVKAAKLVEKNSNTPWCLASR